MSCPGLIGLPRSSSVLTPESLAAALTSLLGSTLIGLWIGEDIVVDGSNNVTSWPGRVGPTATPVSTGRFQQTVENGRKVAVNSSTAAETGLAVTIAAPKATICVGRVSALPFADYNALVNWNSGAQVGTAGLSTWHTEVGLIHFTNGASSETATSLLSVFEADLSTNVTTGLIIGGQATYPTRNWLGSIGLVMALSAVPTTLQRLQTQLILDTYYRPAQAPAAKLALDLYTLFGADLKGLWVGEDLVVDGSNNVTSWPSRIGPTMTTDGTGYFLRRVVDGRAKIYSPDDTAARWLTFNDNWTTKTFISVAKVPSVAGSIGKNIVGVPWGCLFAENVDNVGLWYTVSSWSHYKNGVASEDSSVDGLCVYEADHAIGTPAAVEILGRSIDTGRGWTDDCGLLMALSAVPSAGNRAAVSDLIRSYYSLE